jgi:outer membrane protein OmpA-like peptidoglycan-associated protein
MKNWLFALSLIVVIVPCLTIAQSDEESQRLVAAEEEKAAEWTPKGGMTLIPKDVIIDRLAQCEGITFEDKHILFHYGLPKIKEEAYPQVEEIAAALKDSRLSHIRAYIDGHCCIIGSAEFNCKLSWARAHAVIEELVKRGVPREKLGPRGFSFYYPAHSNEREETRMRNRRVVLNCDTEQVAAPGNLIPCNLAGDPRTKPVEPPIAQQPVTPVPAPAYPPDAGLKGKQPFGGKAAPRGSSEESEWTAKTPFREQAPKQPGR